MLKNKTHRIISISPSSQQSSALRNSNNKTVTPIKPFQHQTRTNTIKATTRPQQSIIDETLKKNECTENGQQSISVSAYKQESQLKMKRGNSNIDQILHRIGKYYDGEKLNHNSSSQLYNKTQISQLRQTIREAKKMVRSKQQNQARFSVNDRSQFVKIETLWTSIRQQISSLFTRLRRQMEIKQKDLLQQLELKIFELKDKNITKSFQVKNLKNYIEKCERDVQCNYQNAVKSLQMNQLTKIVNSYIDMIGSYTGMIKNKYTLKLYVPLQSSFSSYVNNISIQTQKVQEEENIEQKEEQNNILRLSILNMDNRKQSYDKSKHNKSMIGHTKNIKSNFQQIQNMPINKILINNLKKQGDYQPRISSARGNY